MLLRRSGPYALYGNAFANGECVFTMTDMLAFHTTLGSGGLTELKEGHIGLLAVPLQTLPRRGATDAAPLHALEQDADAADVPEAAAVGCVVWQVECHKIVRCVHVEGGGS